jgi:hypothetical protein
MCTNKTALVLGVIAFLMPSADKHKVSSISANTGNGADDGPFVYTGFRPKFIFRKCSSNAGENSMQYDTSMNPYNAAPEFTAANLAAAITSMN